MTPKLKGFPTWTSTSNIECYPESYWKTLYKRLDEHRPSTGAMVIDLVCNYINPSQLRIVGFDFKTTHTLFEKKQNLGPHNWNLEREFAISTITSAKAEGKDWDIV